MAATPSGIAKTTLNYFLELSDGGDTAFHVGTVGEKRRRYLPVSVNVKDIRGSENDFTLDKHGFQLVKRKFTEKTFDDEERIKAQYYPEIAQLLKDVTGASTIRVNNHTVRSRSWESVFEAEKDMPDDARSVGSSNARFVHCDQTYEGARARITFLYPEDADKLDKCRWAVINVWKAFDYPVTRDGLCFADASSVREDELRRIQLLLPPRKDSVQESGDKKNSETSPQPAPGPPPGSVTEAWQCAAPTHPDQHKWYYASEMKVDEALLLKIADSEKNVANKVMHTSFSTEDDHGPERHSLEVRCVVFWENEPVE